VRIDEQLALLACILGQAKQLRASLSLSLSLSVSVSVFFVSFFCGATFRSFGVCAAKHNFVFAFFIFLSIFWFTLAGCRQWRNHELLLVLLGRQS
jgi:hypothetical protein